MLFSIRTLVFFLKGRGKGREEPRERADKLCRESLGRCLDLRLSKRWEALVRIWYITEMWGDGNERRISRKRLKFYGEF